MRSMSAEEVGSGGGPRGLLVHADNRVALPWLARRYAGQVRAVYLDPPYNTGSDRLHYADRLSTSAWRAQLRETFDALRPLLRPDAVVAVQIDDHQVRVLWDLLDEIFGAEQHLATVVVKMSELSGPKLHHVQRRLPKLKEYILFYGNGPEAALSPLRVRKPEAELAGYLRYYAKVIEDPQRPVTQWRPVRIREYLRAQSVEPTAQAVRAFQLENAARVVYRTNNRLLAGLQFETECAPVRSPTGVDYIWWQGRQMLFLEDHLYTWVGDLWTDLSTINLNKEGGGHFPHGKKPEALVQRVLQLCSAPGDLVLDAFGGSGTTAAVAHKMGRDWIVIERGPQCLSHVRPRLEGVISGADQGGITRSVGWAGGGSLRYCAEAALAAP